MINKILDKIEKEIIKTFQPKCIGIFSSFGLAQSNDYFIWFPLSGTMELKYQHMDEVLIEVIYTIWDTD